MIEAFCHMAPFVDHARRMPMIHRPFYLDRIQAYLDKPIVKVITGMRRVTAPSL